LVDGRDTGLKICKPPLKIGSSFSSFLEVKLAIFLSYIVAVDMPAAEGIRQAVDDLLDVTPEVPIVESFHEVKDARTRLSIAERDVPRS